MSPRLSKPPELNHSGADLPARRRGGRRPTVDRGGPLARVLRQSAKVGAAELARLLGVDRRRIHNVERDLRPASDAHILAVLALYLLRGEDA